MVEFVVGGVKREKKRKKKNGAAEFGLCFTIQRKENVTNLTLFVGPSC